MQGGKALPSDLNESHDAAADTSQPLPPFEGLSDGGPLHRRDAGTSPAGLSVTTQPLQCLDSRLSGSFQVFAHCLGCRLSLPLAKMTKDLQVIALRRGVYIAYQFPHYLAHGLHQNRVTADLTFQTRIARRLRDRVMKFTIDYPIPIWLTRPMQLLKFRDQPLDGRQLDPRRGQPRCLDF